MGVYGEGIVTDTYRLGDADFDESRARFYAMVYRHLRYVEGQPIAQSTPAKGKRKKAKQMMIAVTPSPGRDGQPYAESSYFTRENQRGSRNDFGDALEWLILRGKLMHGADGGNAEQARERGHSLAKRRAETADDLLRLMEKAELTPFRSPDYSSTPVSGGGPRHVGISKLVAQMRVQDIRRDVPPVLMALLERVLARNEHCWHNQPKRRQDEIFRAICLALDFAGWSMDRNHGRIDLYDKATADLCRRWPEAFEWLTDRRLRQTGTTTRRRRTA